MYERFWQKSILTVGFKKCLVIIIPRFEFIDSRKSRNGVKSYWYRQIKKNEQMAERIC